MARSCGGLLRWCVSLACAKGLARKVIRMRGKLGQSMALRELGAEHPFNFKILCADMFAVAVNNYSPI